MSKRLRLDAIPWTKSGKLFIPYGTGARLLVPLRFQKRGKKRRYTVNNGKIDLSTNHIKAKQRKGDGGSGG